MEVDATAQDIALPAGIDMDDGVSIESEIELLEKQLAAAKRKWYNQISGRKMTPSII